MNKFLGSIQSILENVTVNYSRKIGFNFDLGDRLELLEKIENITLQLLLCVSRENMPQFQIRYNNDNKRFIAYGRECSRGKFAVIMYMLSKIYRLLASNKKDSELYYENVLKLRDQREIDRALHDICYLLQAPIWQLRVMGTAKGLIAGPITFQVDDEVITVDYSSGTIIPQNVIDITSMSSPAKWILLVEKDAVFQKLIQDGGLNRLGPVIFVTGKGFPDVSTRMLLRRMWEDLRIPILALVDADVYGIDIMCVYRFGSQTMSYHSSELACPAVRWLGVHPTDINRLHIEHEKMNSDEVIKLKNILARPYVAEETQFRKEMELMLKHCMKAEIEGLSKFSTCYLTDSYIPSKILCQEYI